MDTTKKKKLTTEEKIIQGLEGFADALEKGQDITEQYTCRKVVLNLEPRTYNPERVKEVRSSLGLSQSLFAHFIGVSAGTVQSWERGEKTPNPIASRFMDEILEDPSYWRERFLKLAENVAASGGKKNPVGA